MSTNYYLRPDANRMNDNDEIHLGKRAVGWRFLWDADSTNCQSFREVVAMLETVPGTIYSEYGDEVPHVEFVRMARTWGDDKSPCRSALRAYDSLAGCRVVVCADGQEFLVGAENFC